jgi:hypothetical protein
MSDSFDNVVPNMLKAAEGVCEKDWDVVKGYAEDEFNKATAEGKQIAAQVVAGTMSTDDAKTIMTMEANSMKAVLLAVEGISEIAVEQAINAALDVLGSAIEKAIGVSLL